MKYNVYFIFSLRSDVKIYNFIFSLHQSENITFLNYLRFFNFLTTVHLGLQTSITLLFVNENINCEYVFSIADTMN